VVLLLEIFVSPPFLQHVHVKKSSAEGAIRSYIVDTAGSRKLNKKEDFMSTLPFHQISMEGQYRPPRQPSSHKLSKKLSNRTKKKLELFQVPSGGYKYEDFLPLHELWMGYMKDILQVKKPR